MSHAAPVDYDASCPTCGHPVGDHTIRGWGDCTAGMNYHLPYEDNPDGPLVFDGIEGHVVGEATVAACYVEAFSQRLPAVRLTFTGAGPEPMSRRNLPPITLVADPPTLRGFRQLVATAVDRAITEARRGR